MHLQLMNVTAQKLVVSTFQMQFNEIIIRSWQMHWHYSLRNHYSNNPANLIGFFVLFAASKIWFHSPIQIVSNGGTSYQMETSITFRSYLSYRLDYFHPTELYSAHTYWSIHTNTQNPIRCYINLMWVASMHHWIILQLDLMHLVAVRPIYLFD